ncbi:hypothetical protein RJ639_042867 [Escallonia herrerae]|uniref:Large ribosomal subunit protein bL25 beta domain-containing protein n=1 Tax=Escallonia herrerae TaxID=1293975 RepID=A0AA88WBT3_9ASTE|nr:hypothetical protein RJ639_042867 [Escallonia herrerae]
MSTWWRVTTGGLRRAAERPRSYHTIQAIPREITGGRISARDRAQGRIPAVVFAQDYLQSKAARSTSRKHLISTEKRQIQAILSSVQLPYFCSTTFPLQIRAGSGSSVLLESGNVHRDPETGKVLNLVFVWADEGTKLKVDVPLVFKGQDLCSGVGKGGHLKIVKTSLKYLCPSEHIPQKIEVDVSNLDVGERICMHDIAVHPSLKLLSNESIPVCKILSAKLEGAEPATPT